MKSAIRALAVAAAILAPTSLACAGMQVMLVPPVNAVPIRLEASDEAKEATLYIPKALLSKAKRTGADGAKAHAWTAPSALVAGVGLAVALGASCLGLLRLRNRPGGLGLLSILALVVFRIVCLCTLQPNAPVPREIYTRLRAPSADLPAGNVTVSIGDDGDAVRLVVPKSQLAEWAARLKTAEKNAS
jgi:hypothetical protein